MVNWMNEIIIRNGLIVTSNNRINSDIRILDEKIQEIGKNLTKSQNSSQEIDAKRD